MTRTSRTDPLKIDELPCGSGLIGLTLCPGKVDTSQSGEPWDRDLETDLEAICLWGPDIVVTLIEAEEIEKLQVTGLRYRVQSAGIAWLHMPIRDRSIPTNEFELQWLAHGPAIRQELANGSRVLILCRGGVGRTGMVAARLLVEFGGEPAASVSKVCHARSGAIQTPGQEKYVQSCSPIQGVVLKPTCSMSDRIRGCLLGGAVGDAFGYAVEFLDLQDIRKIHGDTGILTPQFHGNQLLVSDDTQMTLFTAEALVAAGASGDLGKPSQVIDQIRKSYLDWFMTQQGQSDTVAAETALLRFPGLWNRRAPGNTCLSGLAAGGTGTPEHPINNSKGCGGVMRIAPIGLIAEFNPDVAFDLGARAAAMTHGHPSGYLSAGALAHIIRNLLDDVGLDACISRAIVTLSGRNGSGETVKALTLARQLAASPVRDPTKDIERLGLGWVGEEALAIAIYAALVATSYPQLISLASNHSGDSDSTASIAGQIWGAMHGAADIPSDWIDRLDVLPVAEEMSDGLIRVSYQTTTSDFPKYPVNSKISEFWEKALDFLQFDWVAVEPTANSKTLVHFMSHFGEIYYQRRFPSIDAAHVFLELCGFNLFVPTPKRLMFRQPHNLGGAYTYSEKPDEKRIHFRI